MLSNKIAPIFALIVNIGLAGFIYSTWEKAKDTMVTQIGGSASVLMYVSLILFTLFVYIGIPLLIFYKEDDTAGCIFRIVDSIITIFVFIFISLIAPVFFKVFFVIIEAISGLGVETIIAQIVMWIIMIALVVVAPIVTYLMQPTKMLKEKYLSGSV